jgi:hypothetical protein
MKTSNLKLPLLSELLHNLAMDCLPRICLCGNLCTNSSGSGCACNDIFAIGLNNLFLLKSHKTSWTCCIMAWYFMDKDSISILSLKKLPNYVCVRVRAPGGVHVKLVWFKEIVYCVLSPFSLISYLSHNLVCTVMVSGWPDCDFWQL